MMTSVSGHGVREALLQHLPHLEMGMKVDNRRNELHHPLLRILAFEVCGLPQALGEASDSSYALLRYPITGIAGCCACAASGHDAAAPPSSVMNSRRLVSDMGSSSRSGDGPYGQSTTHLACRGPGRQVHGADLNWSESGFVQLKAHASAVTV